MQHFLHKRVLEHCKAQRSCCSFEVDGYKQGMYRHPFHHNKKCLVGIFISKANYKPSLEGFGLSVNGDILLAVEESLQKKLNNKEINFLSACQNIHDNCMANGGNLNSKFIRERINEAADKFLYNR